MLLTDVIGHIVEKDNIFVMYNFKSLMYVKFDMTFSYYRFYLLDIVMLATNHVFLVIIVMRCNSSHNIPDRS